MQGAFEDSIQVKFKVLDGDPANVPFLAENLEPAVSGTVLLLHEVYPKVKASLALMFNLMTGRP